MVGDFQMWAIFKSLWEPRWFGDALSWKYANWAVSVLLASVSILLTVDQFVLAIIFLGAAATWGGFLWWRTVDEEGNGEGSRRSPIIVTDSSLLKTRPRRGRKTIGVVVIGAIWACGAYAINSKRSRQHLTEELAERSVDEVTGGHSFCYVKALRFGRDDLRATLISKGERV